MTITATNPTSIVDAVESLHPVITARRDEIEQARRIPADLLERLTAAGCFRAIVPRSRGGAELDLPTHLALIGTLAKSDGSVGWTVMIGSSAPLVLGMLPAETIDAVYSTGPDVIAAGAFNPSGTATPVDGGFRVSGRWSFASGCQHADWFFAHCLVDDGRMPPMRMMVMRPEDVTIEDTWSVSGLCGTGSHDFVATHLFVPEVRSFTVWDAHHLDGPMFRIPELALSSLLIASVAVGIAEGALDEITALATSKTPAFGDNTLATNPLFQNQLGEAHATAGAARSVLRSAADDAWATALAAGNFSDQHRAEIRATAVWAVRAAASVVDTAYTAGGGTAMFSTHPLQRRFRDVHAVTQHFAVKADTFTKVGAVLTGQDTDLTLF